MAVDSPEQYLADLNPAQREAVLATEGPLLVIAGAGSGKTRVLTYRVAHLIHAVGVKPNEILAITFTNKAAGEMKERLEHLLGTNARGLWVLTFHAACGRILRREAKRLGYRSNFTIYDQADQVRLVKQCLEELERDPKRFTPRGIHHNPRFRARLSRHAHDRAGAELPLDERDPRRRKRGHLQQPGAQAEGTVVRPRPRRSGAHRGGRGRARGSSVRRRGNRRSC